MTQELQWQMRQLKNILYGTLWKIHWPYFRITKDTKNIERKGGNYKRLGIICAGQKRVIRDLESELKSKETKVTGNINNTFISILATWFSIRIPSFDFSSITTAFRELILLLLWSATIHKLWQVIRWWRSILSMGCDLHVWLYFGSICSTNTTYKEHCVK